MSNDRATNCLAFGALMAVGVALGVIDAMGRWWEWLTSR